MKKNLSYMMVLGLSLMGLVSCNNAEYQPLGTQAFIGQTNTNGNASQKITLGNEEVSAILSVRLSDKATEDTKFRVVYAPEALAAYNERMSDAYQIYPENLFSLNTSEVTVTAGSSSAANIEITVQPMTQEMKDGGKKYGMAFRLESADGKMPVLASGSTLVYLFDRVVIQPVPRIAFPNSTYIEGNFAPTYKGAEFREWTWEMNINTDNLGQRAGEKNNQALTSISLAQNEIYMRFGDAPIEGNRFQVKTQGTQMNSNMLFEMNTWYHLALSCTGSKLYFYVNGQLDNQMDLPGNPYKMNNEADGLDFSIGKTNYFVMNAMVSEWRFWGVARSQAEIQNNMYSIDPTTNGLWAYFKFNEGEGKDYADATGKGGHASSPNVPTWIPDVRIDGK